MCFNKCLVVPELRLLRRGSTWSLTKNTTSRGNNKSRTGWSSPCVHRRRRAGTCHTRGENIGHRRTPASQGGWGAVRCRRWRRYPQCQASSLPAGGVFSRHLLCFACEGRLASPQSILEQLCHTPDHTMATADGVGGGGGSRSVSCRCTPVSRVFTVLLKTE